MWISKNDLKGQKQSFPPIPPFTFSDQDSHCYVSKDKEPQELAKVTVLDAVSNKSQPLLTNYPVASMYSSHPALSPNHAIIGFPLQGNELMPPTSTFTFRSPAPIYYQSATRTDPVPQNYNPFLLTPPLDSDRFHLLPDQTAHQSSDSIVRHVPITPATTPDREQPPVRAEGRVQKKKRLRRNTRPAMGNNKVGKKGKLICEQCRKIHSKCVFSSENDPCGFCASRNLDCVKVYGPVRSSSNLSASSSSSNSSASNVSNDSSPSTTSSTTPAMRNTRMLARVPQPVSLIFDINLSDRELFLLRRLYMRHQSSKVSSCVGLLLQHLWSSYGSVFKDKTLLYAALTFESYWNDHLTDNWSPSGNVEYYSFKSRFNTSLIDSIGRRDISECHFFALFLASQSSKSGFHSFKQDLAVYQRGMVEIQRFLNRSSDADRYRPLHQQRPFFLSFTRRILCRGDYSMPEYLVADVSTDSLPELELQRVSSQLLPPLRQISGYPSAPCQDDTIELHSWDYWNGINCCLCNEFVEMAGCFEILVDQLPQNKKETYDRLRHTIQRIREKVDKMLNLHDVSYVFKCMADSFEPVNTREGHPYVRGLINFLISMFRASAFLIVLEYLCLGPVEGHRRRVFQEFRRAEDEVARYDRTVWSLRKMELLSAMGLLLGPQLFRDHYDQDMMEHRRWLSEIWLSHYREESVSFERCQTCPCRSLARVQRLWNSPMSGGDYISFLSENSWVWAIEPGWAMEGKLKVNPDRFESSQPACTGCSAT